MKVQELIRQLSSLNPNATIAFASDEEGNLIYKDFFFGEVLEKEYVIHPTGEPSNE